MNIRWLTTCGAILVLVAPLLAFDQPTDARHGVTLGIEGVGEMVATDQPLSFTVRLENGSDRSVAGTVAVGLNDDWQVEGADQFAVSVGPGMSWTASCSATARERVLDALYPVHARLSFERGGGAVELHPIAVFQAVRPVSTAPAVTPQPLVLTPGVWNLVDLTPVAKGWQRKGRTVVLAPGFEGSAAGSGATFSRQDIVRGGVLRRSLGIHPPWKGGHGTLWSDYRLTLPPGQPARLGFHCAIRDNRADEPSSDGVDFRVRVIDAAGTERELFSRFSDAKSWQAGAVDLSQFAGQAVTLRFWNGPGPGNDTTCDNGYWGDPRLSIGTVPPPVGAAQWTERTESALRLAREAAAGTADAPNAFRLQGARELCGAAVVAGDEGLTDAVIAFSDGTRDVAFRGFSVVIDGQAVGGAQDGQPVKRVECRRDGDGWVVSHVVELPQRAAPLTVRATLRADHGVLRVAWEMPGTPRDARGTPRFSKLALGPADRSPARIYLGFGAVFERPGAFTLGYDGVRLGTRHVGADYAEGLSLVQASDLLPDSVLCLPSENRFSLQTPHDACLMLAPSAHGAYAAARAYREVCGFESSPGVEKLLGRVCLDQWGGDYRRAAADLDLAARYGLHDAVFVKHDWQRWGYDYRLPEIYPPHGGLEEFRAMRDAAGRAGMLFAPHDNYIDFYPDAEGFSYDHIVFHADGTTQQAWYHPGRDAQSYRWRPDAFTPWLSANMRRMRDGFAPDALFIDVFTSINPFDYFDRGGAFHTRAETVSGWRDAFDTGRRLLGGNAPMLSESGHDALIGSIDGVQADHWRPDQWLAEYGDADRTPWHDMVTHGKMILFAGGLGHRYDADPKHGYGSDDYLSNTVLGGRAPMCDGPFSRRAVMTYWLLHDACDALARAEMETHRFGATVRRQHTTFSDGGQAWANRGAEPWTLADGRVLPEYGFRVKTRAAEAGVVLLGGRRAGFAETAGSYFADARPRPDPEPGCRVETGVRSAERLGPRRHRVTIDWKVLAPLEPSYVPFVHIGRESAGNDEQIEAQAGMDIEPARLTRAGSFRATADVSVPADFPPGDYLVRYGLYHPRRGDRVPLRGPEERGRRIRGGILRVSEEGGDQYLVEEPSPDDPDINLTGEMIDFGPLATNGAFRLLRADPGIWQLIPLPASRPFRAELRLGPLGAKRATVGTVRRNGPFHEFAGDPGWSQQGDTLRLSCDGLSFGYEIVFE